MPKSNKGTSRTKPAKGRVNIGRTAPGGTKFGRSGYIRALFDPRLPLMWGEREPTRTGPPPNPRQAGVTPRQRRPWLIGGWTAPWRAELDRSGLILALLDSRLPLRQGERGPPRGDLRRIQGRQVSHCVRGGLG